jgi:hypothetical protein
MVKGFFDFCFIGEYSAENLVAGMRRNGQKSHRRAQTLKGSLAKELRGKGLVPGGIKNSSISKSTIFKMEPNLHQGMLDLILRDQSEDSEQEYSGKFGV